MNRPYTIINVAMTADGKIDTFERKGAGISSKRDKERVDELRASMDGILVGGKTLIDENPKLTVKSEALREERTLRGLSPNPIKIGIVTKADISLDGGFVATGPARKVIFTTPQTSKEKLDTLRSNNVEVFVHESTRVDLSLMMQTLKKIGVNNLLVEGGGTINFELMRLGLVDELMVYIAPMIFGGAHAPTLSDGVGLGSNSALTMKLTNVEQWDDSGVVLRYKFQPVANMV